MVQIHDRPAPSILPPVDESPLEVPLTHQGAKGLTLVAACLWPKCENVQDFEQKLLEVNVNTFEPRVALEDVLAIAQEVSQSPKPSPRVTISTATAVADDDELLAELGLTWADDDDDTTIVVHKEINRSPEGKDGPRSRFPHHSDRGAISQLRNRLQDIWLENRVLEGDLVGHDRATHCGELQARKCQKCGVVQCEGHKSRYCCKQRMCPRCMGTQARKPLWKKKELLDQESDLSVYVIALGSFDIGKDVSQWASNARGMVGQAYGWLQHLLDQKCCPESVKTSFSGFRADLHQGYLTLDLVLLGPAAKFTTAYLREYFRQATERDVDVEVIPCRDTGFAINTFGNLMSSMAIYSTPDECQALMSAFKGRRIVQPRGRFMKHPPEEAAAGDVSIGEPSGHIETSRGKSPGGGGEKPPPCHECGGQTVSVGRIGGDWKKVKGEFSGQVYWYLKEPPEEVGHDNRQ